MDSEVRRVLGDIIQQGGRILTGYLQLAMAKRPPPPNITETLSPAIIKRTEPEIKPLPEIKLESTPEPEPVSEPVPETHKVTTPQTIAYQKRELAKELVLLEGHLQQGCKIDGEACDCCEKHPLKIEGLAQEAAGMSPDPIFKHLSNWVNAITPKTTEEASASGQYDAEYPELAITAREYRKALME